MADESMLDKTVRVVDELRECLTEGRALLKDLRHERKAIEKLKKELEGSVAEITEEEFRQHVTAELEPRFRALGEELGKFQRQSEDRITAAFDHMSHILMWGRKKKGPHPSLVRESIMRGKAPFQKEDPPLAPTQEAMTALDEIEENL